MNFAAAQVLVRSIPAPTAGTSALTYDGEAFWSGDNSNRLIRFSITDGTILDTVLSPVNGSDGLSFHDGSLWTISGALSRPRIFQLDIASGTVLDSIPDPANGYSGGMAAQGSDFWVSRYFPTAKMLKVTSEDGTLLDSVDAFGDQVRGVAFSDGYLWTTSVNADADMIYRYDAETGELDWQFSLPEHASLPDRRIRGLAWVDGYLWIVALDQNSSANRILQYDVSNAISPDIVIDSTAHDFGPQVIGFPSDWQFTISNIGNITLNIPSATFGVGAGFSVVDPAAFPVDIPGGAGQVVTVRFDPATPGVYHDTLWIASNDPDESLLYIVLDGIGLANEGDISVSTINLDFGEVWIHGVLLSSSRTVWISNVGPGDLEVSFAEVSGNEFYRDPVNLPATLAPGDSMHVRVWFAPNEESEFSGSLDIASDDPDAPAVSVILTGTGVVPDFEAGQSLWTYGDANDNWDIGINAVQPIGDVNGDGVHDVIFSAATGRTVCLNGSSSGIADTIWTYDTRADPNHSGEVYSPRALRAVTDITGDDVPDVLLGTAGGSRSVYALSGTTGEELWTFDTHIWNDGGWVYAVHEFIDLNNDQITDMLACCGGDGIGRVFALSGASGALLWEGPVYNAFYAIAVIADVSGDDIPEVVSGTTSWVLGLNGATGEQLWRASIGANYYVPDLAWLGNANPGDGDSEDVAAISSGLGIYVIDGETHQQLWLVDVPGFVRNLTILPDMTDDGVREIVYCNSDGVIACLDGAEGIELWTGFAEPDDPENILSLETAPDLNQDDIADLICGTMGNNMVAVSGWDGQPIFSTPGLGAFSEVDVVAVMPDIDQSNVVEILMGNREGWVDCVSAGREIINDAEPTPAPIVRNSELHAAYPNPFNPRTTISFSLETDGPINLSVFNTLGQNVATLIDGPLERGTHSIEFDAGHLPTGLYFYRLAAGSFSDTRKFVLLK